MTTTFQDSVAEVLQNTGALDIGDDDSDDEGEVPPLLGANATTKTVPSIPAAEKKKDEEPKKKPPPATVEIVRGSWKNIIPTIDAKKR